MTKSPESAATAFEECTPSFWQWTGPEYDRNLASLIATRCISREPEKDAEPHDIRALAPLWLDPERVATVPPGLARAAIKAIGTEQWTDLKPLLVALQSKLGPPTEEEKRLARIEKDKSGSFDRSLKLRGRSEWLAGHEQNAMEREERDLTVKMIGDLRFELRKPIAEALGELKKPTPRKPSE